MNLQKQIRTARKAAGLTQREVARAIGVRPSIVSRYESENNTIVPPTGRLAAMADLFNVEFDINSGSLNGQAVQSVKYEVWKDGALRGYVDLIPEHKEFLSKLGIGVYFIQVESEEM